MAEVGELLPPRVRGQSPAPSPKFLPNATLHFNIVTIIVLDFRLEIK